MKGEIRGRVRREVIHNEWPGTKRLQDLITHSTYGRLRIYELHEFLSVMKLEANNAAEEALHALLAIRDRLRYTLDANAR